MKLLILFLTLFTIEAGATSHFNKSHHLPQSTYVFTFYQQSESASSSKPTAFYKINFFSPSSENNYLGFHISELTKSKINNFHYFHWKCFPIYEIKTFSAWEMVQKYSKIIFSFFIEEPNDFPPIPLPPVPFFISQTPGGRPYYIVNDTKTVLFESWDDDLTKLEEKNKNFIKHFKPCNIQKLLNTQESD